MAIGFISLLFSLFSLLFFGISFAKPIPRFPSSIIQPEKLSVSAPNELYKERFFTQVLDHFTFRPQSYKTFQQRYLINDKYWGGAEKNAPIFLYTGNEGDIEWFAQNTGFVFDTAPQFKALLVFIEGESENCYKVIKRSWQEIEDTASQPGGLEILRKSFKICKNYISASSLQGWLETAWVYTAMTDYPTPSNFLSPMPAFPVKEMCKAIDDPKTRNNTFAKLYGAASVYYNYSGMATCFDLDDDSDPHGLGGWSWQACTEMIMPTSGNNKESMFPASTWSYNERASSCKAGFGVEPRPTWITAEFGGHVRAHHVDLRFETNEDPKWLRDVRKRESYWFSYDETVVEVKNCQSIETKHMELDEDNIELDGDDIYD
ncbi:unnamed protein product [Dovyalis caffra]|uniref:Uncharacterized protein n=1 Tax=Dovyalis caffra TaxID=77055 RepID=A0AAV1RYV2_9ROSI|nr:unnamed protein product [Dovyalis caffra]